jgi:hypothetical protein
MPGLAGRADIAGGCGAQADVLDLAGQVLNGHFKGFTTVEGTPA